jgi:hypothetical protein
VKLGDVVLCLEGCSARFGWVKEECGLGSYDDASQARICSSVTVCAQDLTVDTRSGKLR